MKQTRSLSEFSGLSEYTPLYPNKGEIMKLLSICVMAWLLSLFSSKLGFINSLHTGYFTGFFFSS